MPSLYPSPDLSASLFPPVHWRRTTVSQEVFAPSLIRTECHFFPDTGIFEESAWNSFLAFYTIYKSTVFEEGVAKIQMHVEVVLMANDEVRCDEHLKLVVFLSRYISCCCTNEVLHVVFWQ